MKSPSSYRSVVIVQCLLLRISIDVQVGLGEEIHEILLVPHVLPIEGSPFLARWCYVI